MTKSIGWRPRRTTLIGALGVVALDQLTKLVAVARLEPSTPRPVIGDFVTLTLARNPGAAFSFATGATVLFTALAFAAVGVGVVMIGRPLPNYQCYALALGLGGVSGNLIDRVLRTPGGFSGHVIDFISVGNWPIFNIADSALCIAAVVVVIGGYRADKRA